MSYAAAAALDDDRVPLILSARDYAYGCATRTLLHRGRICEGPAPPKCLACSARAYGPLKGAVATAGVRAFRATLAARVHVLHSISTYVRDMVRRDFLDDRVSGIPHVIIPSFGESEPFDAASADPAEIARLDAELPDRPFILFVGALRRPKGIEPLLEAYRRLSDPPPLVLAGTREADTPRDVPPGVTVIEDVPHSSVMLAWRRALFGVAPSLWPEPLGSVVYEGMSQGRAVIGTVPGGHADMIEDGISGILVPAGDVSALVGAMKRLIDDPAERERLGLAAADRARLFTAVHVMPRWERTYRDAIAAARSRDQGGGIGDAVIVEKRFGA
jgi:glycosyltransferase involved in cell wall biosynthesis